MNPALLQKGSNSFRTDSEIKDHEGGVSKVQDFGNFEFSPVCLYILYIFYSYTHLGLLFVIFHYVSFNIIHHFFLDDQVVMM